MSEPIESQVCRGCNKEKPLSEYHKDRTQKNGHKHTCKKCRSTVQGRLKTSPHRRVSSTEESLLQEARVRALKQLVDNYPREFRQLLARSKRELGIEPTWHELK